MNFRGEQCEGNPEPTLWYMAKGAAHVSRSPGTPGPAPPLPSPDLGVVVASLCVRSGPVALLSLQRGEETIPALGTCLQLCLSWAQNCPLLPLQLRIRRPGLYAESGTCDPGAEWEALPQAKTVREFQQQVSQEDP